MFSQKPTTSNQSYHCLYSCMLVLDHWGRNPESAGRTCMMDDIQWKGTKCVKTMVTKHPGDAGMIHTVVATPRCQ